FSHDGPRVVYPLFAVEAAVTALFTLGLFTRVMNVAVWLLTMCFITRNLHIINGGDGVMQALVFLLMLSPSGKALSLDSWRRRRRTGDTAPAYTPAWPLRLIQIPL